MSGSSKRRKSKRRGPIRSQLSTRANYRHTKTKSTNNNRHAKIAEQRSSIGERRSQRTTPKDELQVTLGRSEQQSTNNNWQIEIQEKQSKKTIDERLPCKTERGRHMILRIVRKTFPCHIFLSRKDMTAISFFLRNQVLILLRKKKDMTTKRRLGKLQVTYDVQRCYEATQDTQG